MKNVNVNTDVMDNVDVKKAPGRPVVQGSNRQLLLKKKEMLKAAGVVEAGRPIDIEKTEALIAELQEKVNNAKLRMEIESKIDAELGLS